MNKRSVLETLISIINALEVEQTVQGMTSDALRTYLGNLLQKSFGQ
jgi:hypothetical protein